MYVQVKLVNSQLATMFTADNKDSDVWDLLAAAAAAAGAAGAESWADGGDEGICSN